MSVVAAAIGGSALLGAGTSMYAANQTNKRANADRALAQQAQNVQLGLAQQQQEVANEYNDYNKETYRPLEKQLVNESLQAGTQGELDRAAGDAAAGVKSAFARNAEASGRSLARMGINPASSRALAVRVNDDAMSAVNSAAAANTAREGAKAVAYGKKMDAASLGRNLPSAQAAAANGAIAGANGAASTGVNLMNAGLNQSRITAGLQQDAASNISSGVGMALRYGVMGK